MLTIMLTSLSPWVIFVSFVSVPNSFSVHGICVCMGTPMPLIVIVVHFSIEKKANVEVTSKYLLVLEFIIVTK